MTRETAGLLTKRDLRRALEFNSADQAVDELVRAGFWERTPEGDYQLVHHLNHQPEPEVMARRREATAERVRRHRLKTAGINPDTGEMVTQNRSPKSSPQAPPEEPGNGVTERVTRDGTGRDGAGKRVHNHHGTRGRRSSGSSR